MTNAIPVTFDAVRNELVGFIRRNMLIPILGSGFSRGCRSVSGTVPSGAEYQKYMIGKIRESEDYDASYEEELQNSLFSDIADIYHQSVPEEEQRSYLRDHFTRVWMNDEGKKAFLKKDWLYLYTLNIDDAIEQNSEYKCVIHSNREVAPTRFDEEKCVIKLHGDINEMLAYKDSISEVFGKKQYILSLQRNKSLLDHLTHDFTYNTPIYIGCSLSDEIDLLSASLKTDGLDRNNIRYYCTTGKPTKLELNKLSNYGIDKCIVFDSYDDIYEKLNDAAEEAKKIQANEIENCRLASYSYLDSDFEKNKPYLFHGKNPVNKDRTVTLPYYFISRDVTKDIIDNITQNDKNIQFLMGSGCSGKTYIAIDVVRQIRDRDVFMFSSADSLNEKTLDTLLSRENCLIVADNNCLTMEQIEKILKKRETLRHNHAYWLIFERINNHELTGKFTYLKLSTEIENREIPIINIYNRLNEDETKQLNEHLVATTLGVFDVGFSNNDGRNRLRRSTLADNIIRLSGALEVDNRFSRTVPKKTDVLDIACLVALATEQKIYSSEAVQLNLVENFARQARIAAPLIEAEETLFYEKSGSNNSPQKYVINAEYWLYDQLNDVSKTDEGRSRIIRAYKYIMTKLIDACGKPELARNNADAPYKAYILFDKMNQIFHKHGLSLIREIYAQLNDLLAADPHYMHQRAKCYMRSSEGSRETVENKMNYIQKAFRDATTAHQEFYARFESTANDKVYISAAHAQYTRALALCHWANFEKYGNKVLNTNAITILNDALQSPYNTYKDAETDRDNYGNVIQKTVSTIAADKSLIEEKAIEALESLLKIIIVS